MSFTTAGLVLAQVVVAAVVGWMSGRVLLKWAFGPRAGALRGSVGLPERGLAAVAGFIAFSGTLAVGNIASGGAVFGSWAPVPVAAVGVFILGWRVRGYPRGIPWLRLACFCVLLFTFFVLPVVRGGTGVRTGDPPWHLGWSEQLLGGEPVPVGPAPEYARNAYPWGFHAVIATLVRLVPGSDPLVAHEALHVLIVAAIPLAAACLARRINSRSGWGAAAAVAFIGGFGWIAAGEPDFITIPLLARYGADLVVASPNSAYELFPPAFPRELGLVLLGAAGSHAAIAWREPHRRSGLASGVALGLAGLVSIPMFVAGVAWILSGVTVVRRGFRLRLLGWVVAGTFATMAAWLLPLVVNYIRFGGFVNVTPRLGVEWPLPTALWSWGLLLPLAIAGVVVAAKLREGSARLVLAFGAGSVILLALSVVRGEFEWELGGNATLLHQGRAWPPVHLLGAAFAGVALMAAYERFSARRRLAAVICTGVIAAGSISPWFASRHITEVIENKEDGFLYTRPDLVRDSFVRQVGDRLRPRDVVRVEGSNFLALMLFQFSGARLAQYENEDLAGNDLRIRFAELAQAWNERMDSGGFAPDYVLVRQAEAPPNAEPLLTGEFGEQPETWVLLESN